MVSPELARHLTETSRRRQTVLVVTVGRLGDMFGKERVLVIVLAALTAGSLVAALTSSIAVMIAARVLQGLAGAIMTPQVLAIATIGGFMSPWLLLGIFVGSYRPDAGVA